jgi:protein-tyrosine phosphatase
MIDLHCHMLPGIDDGSPDLATSLAMAKIAVADGIQVTACTPHIYPGLYENDSIGIASAVEKFRQALERDSVGLRLTYGADIQIVPELLAGLRCGTHPTLNKSRYFLFEPPHHTVPVRFHESIHDTVAAGYVPVITHPERLTWLDDEYYPWFVQAAKAGAWIQVTSGALTGRFGRQAKYWGERMLDDGIVHILATDSHDPHHRPPVLSEGRAVAANWLDEAEAERMVSERPQAILDDRPPAEVAAPPMLDPSAPRSQKAPKKKQGWLSRLFGED